MGKWVKIALKSLAKIEYGKSPKGIETPDGKYPIWGTGGLVGKSNHFLFRAPAIIVGRKGTLGNPIYSNNNFWVIDTAYAVLPNSSISPKFLFYILKNIRLEKFNEATGVPSLSRDSLYKIQIKIPEDLQEQFTVAIVLNTIDQAIEKTEQLIAKYERIKTGLMQDLLTRGIDEQGNIRSEETHEFKDSVLGKIPVGWKVGGIGEFCFVTKLAGFEFTNHFKYIEDGEIIALRALNIKNEKLDLANVQRISKKVSDLLTRSKLYAGDVLITYIGAYIGDVVQIRENDKYHLAPNIAKIAPPDYIINDFLEIYLRSCSVQRQMKNATATTATPSLTMGQIRSLNIAFPKDKNEQKRIVEAINTVNLNLINNEENLANLKRLKTALMQDLLTGKVCVGNLTSFLVSF